MLHGTGEPIIGGLCLEGHGFLCNLISMLHAKIPFSLVKVCWSTVQPYLVEVLFVLLCPDPMNVNVKVKVKVMKVKVIKVKVIKVKVKLNNGCNECQYNACAEADI
jgi:hypothetical protein